MSDTREPRRVRIDWDRHARRRARAGLAMGPASLVAGAVLTWLLSRCWANERAAAVPGVLLVVAGHLFSLFELLALVVRLRRIGRVPVATWLLLGYWVVLLLVLGVAAWTRR